MADPLLTRGSGRKASLHPLFSLPKLSWLPLTLNPEVRREQAQPPENGKNYPEVKSRLRYQSKREWFWHRDLPYREASKALKETIRIVHMLGAATIRLYKLDLLVLFWMVQYAYI